MIDYVISLEHKAAKYRNIAGGKGATLHKLKTLNYFNIPRSFIVKTNALRYFILQNGLDEQLENITSNIFNNSLNVHDLLGEIRKVIQIGEIPNEILEQINRKLLSSKEEYYAVRSSASFEDGKEHSWAGQFDSYLNVAKSNIDAAIKSCWSSVFNERAIRYNPAPYKSFQKINFAVLIQEMIPADVSGVAFSVSPENGKKFVKIEAVRGLGDSLVSGNKIPYSIEVDKRDQLFSNYLKNEYLLTDILKPGLITEIFNACIKIEKTCRFPVDIEWAIKNEKLYILQSRAITKSKENG